MRRGPGGPLAAGASLRGGAAAVNPAGTGAAAAIRVRRDTPALSAAALPAIFVPQCAAGCDVASHNVRHGAWQ